MSYWIYSFMMAWVSLVSVYSFMMMGVSPLECLFHDVSCIVSWFPASAHLPWLWYKYPMVIYSLREIDACTHNQSSAVLKALPVPVLARTSSGRVGLRNACRLRVHLHGWRAAITFLGSVVGGTTTRIILFFLVATHVIGLIGTATLLHGIERDDYSDRRYVN